MYKATKYETHINYFASKTNSKIAIIFYIHSETQHLHVCYSCHLLLILITIFQVFFIHYFLSDLSFWCWYVIDYTKYFLETLARGCEKIRRLFPIFRGTKKMKFGNFRRDIFSYRKLELLIGYVINILFLWIENFVSKISVSVFAFSRHLQHHENNEKVYRQSDTQIW